MHPLTTLLTALLTLPLALTLPAPPSPAPQPGFLDFFNETFCAGEEKISRPVTLDTTACINLTPPSDNMFIAWGDDLKCATFYVDADCKDWIVTYMRPRVLPAKGGDCMHVSDMTRPFKSVMKTG